MEKAFEKQTKTTEDQGEKQADVLKHLRSNTQVLANKSIIAEYILNEEAKNELINLKK